MSSITSSLAKIFCHFSSQRSPNLNSLPMGYPPDGSPSSPFPSLWVPIYSLPHRGHPSLTLHQYNPWVILLQPTLPSTLSVLPRQVFPSLSWPWVSLPWAVCSAESWGRAEATLPTHDTAPGNAGDNCTQDEWRFQRVVDKVPASERGMGGSVSSLWGLLVTTLFTSIVKPLMSSVVYTSVLACGVCWAHYFFFCLYDHHFPMFSHALFHL